MKALILAAGLGSRLRPITDKVPKCMVEVKGQSIISRQIENLIQSGIKDICIVGGYKADILYKHIKGMLNFFTFIENKEYEVTNNMYSLYLARHNLYGEPFILLNGDVVFDQRILDHLLKNQDPNLIVCQKDYYLEESMKISFKNNRIDRISKTIEPAQSYGTSIDIYKFSSAASKTLFDIIYQILYIEKNLNSWSEVAIDRLLKHHIFLPLNIIYPWVEIDNFEDLLLANTIF
ncbi:MAG: phosphocholine cytidylyltransferase family protein [Bacteroidales bacterium]|nr:phosphocholine cytidylyltransferase family protein [Bacteroidales bacterium]